MFLSLFLIYTMNVRDWVSAFELLRQDNEAMRENEDTCILEREGVCFVDLACGKPKGVADKFESAAARKMRH